MQKRRRATMRGDEFLEVFPHHFPHHAEHLHEIAFPRAVRANDDIDVTKRKVAQVPYGLEPLYGQSVNFLSHFQTSR
jgi:hypothetical protein